MTKRKRKKRTAGSMSLPVALLYGVGVLGVTLLSAMLVPVMSDVYYSTKNWLNKPEEDV